MRKQGLTARWPYPDGICWWEGKCLSAAEVAFCFTGKPGPPVCVQFVIWWLRLTRQRCCGHNAENDQHADINLYAVAFLSSDDPASWTPAALRFMCLCICGPSVAAWNRCMQLNLKHWPQRAIVWVRSVRTQLLIAGNVFPSCCQHAANHQEHTDVSSGVEFAQVRAQTLALLR